MKKNSLILTSFIKIMHSKKIIVSIFLLFLFHCSGREYGDRVNLKQNPHDPNGGEYYKVKFVKISDETKVTTRTKLIGYRFFRADDELSSVCKDDEKIVGFSEHIFSSYPTLSLLVLLIPGNWKFSILFFIYTKDVNVYCVKI